MLLQRYTCADANPPVDKRFVTCVPRGVSFVASARNKAPTDNVFTLTPRAGSSTNSSQNVPFPTPALPRRPFSNSEAKVNLRHIPPSRCATAPFLLCLVEKISKFIKLTELLF
jgi:hypothetical protein